MIRSSEVSLKYTCIGNSMRVLCENFWQGEVLHIDETKEQPSCSGWVLAVFRQLNNGNGSTQDGDLLTFSNT